MLYIQIDLLKVGWQIPGVISLLVKKETTILESCTRDIDCTLKSCPLSSLFWRTALYENPIITIPVKGWA